MFPPSFAVVAVLSLLSISNAAALPPVSDRFPEAPVTEVTFRDAAGSKEDGKLPQRYSSHAPLYALVEVRPGSATNDAKVSLILNPAGLSGLKVEVNGNRWTSWANLTGQEAECELPHDPASAAWTSLHVSTAPASGMNRVTEAPIKSAPARTMVKPHELIVLVERHDPEDHLKGWTDFPEMLAKLPLNQRK